MFGLSLQTRRILTADPQKLILTGEGLNVLNTKDMKGQRISILITLLSKAAYFVGGHIFNGKSLIFRNFPGIQLVQGPFANRFSVTALCSIPQLASNNLSDFYK